MIILARRERSGDSLVSLRFGVREKRRRGVEYTVSWCRLYILKGGCWGDTALLYCDDTLGYSHVEKYK